MLKILYRTFYLENSCKSLPFKKIKSRHKINKIRQQTRYKRIIQNKIKILLKKIISSTNILQKIIQTVYNN
jgi:hypothetical protein